MTAKDSLYDSEIMDKKRCPSCGRYEDEFTTISIGDGSSWTTECKCGELIDED